MLIMMMFLYLVFLLFVFYCSKMDFWVNIYVVFLFVFNLLGSFDSDFGMVVLYSLGFVIDIFKLCELEEFVI